MECNITDLKENITCPKGITKLNVMSKVSTSVFIVASIGFVWNVIAISMLYRCRKMRYHIKVIAINLALADLITVVYSFVDAFISFITIFAIDGFLCLRFAMRYFQVITKRSINFICLAAWIISFKATVLAHVGGFKRTFACICFDNRGHAMISLFYRNLCFLTIIILYIYIFWHIRQQNQKITKMGNHQVKNIRPAIKISAIVGIVFVMYIPKSMFLIYSMLSGSFIHDSLVIFTPLVYIEKLNSMINPVMYVWRFRECRMHVIKTFCWFSKHMTKKAREINYELNGTFLDTKKRKCQISIINTKEEQ
ncbi:hypothetical protein KUTeg_008376 [Tegillarca granosa]|uniref:G-protein coupled receptors family 1 profile domain-containing protein n=1 Tax=Tegillarca granosa TaxID=220873 RepID=A0ABQ9FDV6_TEGGR|nr:hypothetical protein KUTeg_008376 [Tegillarca granosa]